MVTQYAMLVIPKSSKVFAGKCLESSKSNKYWRQIMFCTVKLEETRLNMKELWPVKMSGFKN